MLLAEARADAYVVPLILIALLARPVLRELETMVTVQVPQRLEDRVWVRFLFSSLFAIGALLFTAHGAIIFCVRM